MSVQWKILVNSVTMMEINNVIYNIACIAIDRTSDTLSRYTEIIILSYLFGPLNDWSPRYEQGFCTSRAQDIMLYIDL